MNFGWSGMVWVVWGGLGAHFSGFLMDSLDFLRIPMNFGWSEMVWVVWGGLGALGGLRISPDFLWIP